MIGPKYNLTGTGGSGQGVNGVSFDELKVAFIGELTQDNVQDALDLFSVTIPINMGVFLLFTHYVEGDSGPITVAKYLFKNNQATTVFNPGNPIQYEDLIYIGSVTGAEVIQFGTTQVIELGEIADTDVSDFVNTHGPYAVQDSSTRYVVFRSTRADIEVLYLFLNEGGVYGIGETQTTEADFAPFDTTTGAVVPSLGQVLAVANRQPKLLQDLAYTMEAADATKTLINYYFVDLQSQELTLPKSIFKLGDQIEYKNYGNSPAKILPGDPYFVQLVCGQQAGNTSILVPPGYTVKLKYITQELEFTPGYWMVSFESGEILPLKLEGIAEAYGVQTLVTGPLYKGEKYTIQVYEAGDDFVGGGAANNDIGTSFTYNGGAVVYDNGSELLSANNMIITPFPGQNTLGFSPVGIWDTDENRWTVTQAGKFIEFKTSIEIQSTLNSKLGILRDGDNSFIVQAAASFEFVVNTSFEQTKITIELYP